MDEGNGGNDYEAAEAEIASASEKVVTGIFNYIEQNQPVHTKQLIELFDFDGVNKNIILIILHVLHVTGQVERSTGGYWTIKRGGSSAAQE